MEEYLYKYFVIYSRLAIPDIGQFTMEVIPASVDGSGRLLLAPASRVLFAEGPVSADKHFFDFITAEMNVDEVDAIRRFRDYAASLKQEAAGDAGVTLTGIGQLHHSDGKLVFSPATPEHILPAVSLPDGVAPLPYKQAVAYNETVVAEHSPASVSVSEITEEEEVTERSGSWWIYAVILLLAAISAILFYYA